VLTLRGQEVYLPIISSTEDEHGIDISSMRSQAGYITVDLGFGNTGACESRITYIDSERGILRYRGYPIEQLAEHGTFVEVAWLLIWGELPTAARLRKFRELLTAQELLYEGMRHHFMVRVPVRIGAGRPGNPSKPELQPGLGAPDRLIDVDQSPRAMTRMARGGPQLAGLPRPLLDGGGAGDRTLPRHAGVEAPMELLNHDTMALPLCMERTCSPHRDLRALHASAQILAAGVGQEEILLEILKVLEQELGMMRGTVMLLSPDESELIIAAASNVDEEVRRRVRYRKGEGITGEVVRTGRSIIVPRVADEPRFQDRIHCRTTSQKKEVSFICVPVMLGSEVVGTLAVDLPCQELSKLQDQEQLLGIVASMIANDVKARRVARLERQALETVNLQLRDALGEKLRPSNMVGNSRAAREVYQRIVQVAGANTTCLIRGESGTGKELVATAIHFQSARRQGPFVKVNCAALSDNLLESELFGHERGAFTGALNARDGRFEEARSGTLFLDEIGDFSPSVQVKLLRVLQEREFERVGSNTTLKADVRILAATNRDLEKAVREGSFRQDLYYRINVFSIWLPPLRERRDDILLLANFFVQKYAQQMGKSVHRISTPAINMMMAYHWPGNVRELENCIEHAVLLSGDGVIAGHHLPPTLQMPGTSDRTASGSFKLLVNSFERDLISDALKRTDGNINAAARELGITARMVRYKVRNLQIDYQDLFKRTTGPSRPPAQQ
jgi:Nif-specific regulatory protein